jgi:hypothetical protein
MRKTQRYDMTGYDAFDVVVPHVNRARAVTCDRGRTNAAAELVKHGAVEHPLGLLEEPEDAVVHHLGNVTGQ